MLIRSYSLQNIASFVYVDVCVFLFMMEKQTWKVQSMCKKSARNQLKRIKQIQNIRIAKLFVDGFILPMHSRGRNGERYIHRLRFFKSFELKIYLNF